MRTKLAKKRHALALTQKEASAICGISVGAYAQLEGRNMDGHIATWEKVQEGFGIKDSEMWRIIKEK